MSKSTPADIEGLRSTLLDCLKRMEKVISSFNKETPMDTLEAHAEVLELYWTKTVDANLTIISSTERIYGNFPEVAIYLNSKIKLKSIMKCRKMFLFNKSLACIGMSEVIAKISTFKETTPVDELDAYTQLLEDYWSKYSKAYSEIFAYILELDEDRWMDIPKQERNKYFNMESSYVEAKLRLQRLKSQLISVSNS